MNGRATALALLTISMLPASAMARSAATVPYPAEQVWPTAVRFLRVDRGCAITEKDEGVGYVLFEVIERERKHAASLELVKVTDRDGRPSTSVVITIADLPRHHETLLLDKLQNKLKDERGAPAPPPPKNPAPPAPSEDKGKARQDKEDSKNDSKKDSPPSLEYYRE